MESFYPPDFDQRTLWDDPLKPPSGVYSGAVLVSEEIERYVLEHNLIFDRTDFLETRGKLKGASYTMTPHPNDAWECREGLSHRPLEKGRDSRGEFYVVPRNSLVFIRLQQKLRLPFYLIGRHNLKISYVYKGLLLGTGPQVDPGYTGRLYIPLHNFTTSPVYIYIDQSFVSIDFVRTTHFRLDPAKPTPKNVDQLYDLYHQSKHLIPREKLERDYLDAYLGGSQPRSSLGAFVVKFNRMTREFRARKFIEYGMFVAVVAIVATYFIGMKTWLGNFVIHFDKKIDAKVERDVQSISDLQRRVNELDGTVKNMHEQLNSMRFASPALPAVDRENPSPSPKKKR